MTPPASCSCIPCQLGWGSVVVCKDTEARIRADERKRLKDELHLGISLGERDALVKALSDLKQRRLAQRLLHALLAVLDPGDDDAETRLTG